MPATVIAERIGWDRSMTVLKDRVRELRPLFVPPDPAGRTEYRPASWPSGTCGSRRGRSRSAGQEARPPVIVGVSGYSRTIVGG